MKGVFPMKKILCMALVLVLCLGAAALAENENVPSKTTEDLAKVEAVAENGVSISIFVYQSDYADEQLKKLQEAPSISEYFGGIRQENGAVASLTDLLGSEEIEVNEFAALGVENYDASYGKVTAKFLFSTPYAKDDKVIVLVGLTDGGVVWYAFEGTVIDDEGTIEVVFNPDILVKVQEDGGLIAIASKPAAAEIPADASSGDSNGDSNGDSAGAPAGEEIGG